MTDCGYTLGDGVILLWALLRESSDLTELLSNKVGDDPVAI